MTDLSNASSSSSASDKKEAVDALIEQLKLVKVAEHKLARVLGIRQTLAQNMLKARKLGQMPKVIALIAQWWKTELDLLELLHPSGQIAMLHEERMEAAAAIREMTKQAQAPKA